MAEKTVDSLATKLQKYQELSRKRAVLEDMLHKAEGEKESVKQGIYQRVCREYQSELDEVNEELDPLHTEIDRWRGQWSTQLRDTEAKAKEIQEGLEEHEFRYRVGEYDDAKFSKLETPLKKQLEECFKTSSDLRSKLEQIEAARQSIASAPTEDRGERPRETTTTPRSGSKTNKTNEEEPILAGVSGGETSQPTAKGNPTTQKSTSASSGPSTKPNAAAQSVATDSKAPVAPTAKTEKKRVDEKGESSTPKNGDDIVDLSDWTKEFQHEKKMSGRRTSDTAPQPPKAPTAAPSDEEDALSGLADPSLSSPDPPSKPSAPDPPSKSSAPAPPSKEPERTKTSQSSGPLGGFPVLIIVKGPGAGKKLPLVPVTMTLGREHDNNIELKDEEVARYHARISFERGQYVLEDLDSSPGTWVNDEKIDQAVLAHGDKIRVGTTEMIIDFE